MTCCFCDEPIKEGQAVRLTAKLHRHRGCEPGSKRYLANTPLATPYCDMFGMSVGAFQAEFTGKKAQETDE